MGLQARMKKLASKYKDAKKRDRSGGDFEKVPDGVYVMSLDDATIGESKASNRLQITWVYTVDDGEHAGRKVWDYQGLEGDDSLFYAQRHIERLGGEVPDDIGELGDALEALIGTQFNGRVRTKNEFTHVHVNKLLAEPEGKDAPASAPAEADGNVEPEPAAAEPEEETVTAEEEVLLDVGMAVSFESKGKTLEGEILEFIDDDTRARVKVGKRVLKVKLEALNPAEEDA